MRRVRRKDVKSGERRYRKRRREAVSTTDYKKVLERSDVDAVLVSTSWEMHISVSCDAMKAGKIVAMEAGGANSEEDCWKLVRTYEETFGVDTEYLLGEDLLVAPAFLGENEREIYLPEGKWRDYFTGEIAESGRRTVATNKIAVFEKII